MNERSATDDYTMWSARYLLNQRAHHATEPELTCELCDVHLAALTAAKPAVGKSRLIIEIQALKEKFDVKLL